MGWRGWTEDLEVPFQHAVMRWTMIPKPPLGLKPRYIHRAERIRDIVDAMEIKY